MIFQRTAHYEVVPAFCRLWLALKKLYAMSKITFVLYKSMTRSEHSLAYFTQGR